MEKTAVTKLYPSVQTLWSGTMSMLRSTPTRSRKDTVTVKNFLMDTPRLVRCEVLDDSSCNIRWNVTFIPSGSTWIYSLAKSAGWEIRTKSPDPSSVAVFSWRSVFGLFQRAFETGSVTLPIVLIEGSTRLFLSRTGLVISETVDLIEEADKKRLQNRRVAQELASCLGGREM